MTTHAMHVRFRGTCVAVETDSDRARLWLQRRFGSMLDPTPNRIVAHFTLATDGTQHTVFAEGDERAHHGDLVSALERLSYEIAAAFIAAHIDLLWLHAGAVSRDGAAILLAGAWGRGKSTLSVTLAREGWEFLSDDLVPADAERGVVLPFPRSPTSRRPSKSVLPRDRVPSLPKREWPHEQLRIATAPARIVAVAFPHYEHGTTSTLTRCGPAEGVVRLLDSCVNLTARGDAAVNETCRLFEHARAYRLAYGDANNAARRLATLAMG